ncbi:MAG: lysophospholipid acyltransferase family protein [Cyanobacteria bacterium P01_H01_bin.15]
MTQPISSHSEPWLARMVYPLGCRVVIPTFFGQVTVIGREHIPENGPVIVAPTHRSRWDGMMVPYAVGRWISKRDLHYMVSANEVSRGLQGWILRRMGAFPVDTERPQASSVSHSVELLLENRMLVIFPEGGIYRDGTIHPLKRGVARIAVDVESRRSNSGMRILPIQIEYSNAFPTWGTNVRLNIGPAIDVASYCGDSPRKSSQVLTQVLHDALGALASTSQQKCETALWPKGAEPQELRQQTAAN